LRNHSFRAPTSQKTQWEEEAINQKACDCE